MAGFVKLHVVKVDIGRLVGNIDNIEDHRDRHHDTRKNEHQNGCCDEFSDRTEKAAYDRTGRNGRASSVIIIITDICFSHKCSLLLHKCILSEYQGDLLPQKPDKGQRRSDKKQIGQNSLQGNCC